MSRKPAYKMITVPVRSALERLMLDLRSIGVKPHASPIIVFGNQKSGTSAIGALLGEISGVPVALDLKREFKNPSTDRLRSGELSMAEFVRLNRLDFSYQIVKEPALTPFYRELRAYFPRSRFVTVIRDPRDNIRSILNRVRIAGNLNEIPADAENITSAAWKLVMDGRWMGITSNHYIDQLAERWNLTSDVYLESRDDILMCKYETFLQDKQAEIIRLAQALDLPTKHDIADKVDRPFQPPGDHNVTWLDFFGKENIRRIERICGDRMKVLGYASAA